MTEEQVHTFTGRVTFPNQDGIAKVEVWLLKEHYGTGYHVSAEAYVEERLDVRYTNRPVPVERPLYNGITKQWINDETGAPIPADSVVPPDPTHGYSHLGISEQTGIYLNGDDVGTHVLPPLDLRYRQTPDGSIAPRVLVVIRGGYGLRDVLDVGDIPGEVLLAPPEHWDQLNKLAPWNAAVHPFGEEPPAAPPDEDPLDAHDAPPASNVSLDASLQDAPGTATAPSTPDPS